MTNLANNFRAAVAPLAVAALVALGCASGSGPDWTYAPLGPTPAAGASAAATPGGSPEGQGLELATQEAAPLAFDPNELSAPAATVVTVQYNNNSSLEHNVDFFAGQDQNAPSLGATERVTGPNQLRSVTFTTPDAPGDYYFWCDVHLAAMSGTLHVTEAPAASAPAASVPASSPGSSEPAASAPAASPGSSEPGASAPAESAPASTAP